MIRRIAIAAALVVGLVLSVGVATAFAGSLPDGARARFHEGGVRGLVVLSYTGTTNVNAGVLGLLSSQEYYLTGRSIPCSGSPSAANRVFRLTGMTDASGMLNIVRTVNVMELVPTFWLVPTDGSSPPVCAISFNFGKIQVTSDWNGDGRVGLTKMGTGTLGAMAVVEQLANDRARLSIVVDGLSGNDTYSLRFVSGKCGHPAGNSFVSNNFQSPTGNFFSTRVAGMTASELGKLRSVRIRNQTAGHNSVCVPLNVIMANTEG